MTRPARPASFTRTTIGSNSEWRWRWPRWVRPLAPRRFLPLWRRRVRPIGKRSAFWAGLTRTNGARIQPTNNPCGSFDCYNRAFEIEPPDFYPGINAATVAFLLGETDKAHGLARRVLEICQAQPEDYWRDATIAETLVILGDLEGAKKAYRAAVGTARDNLHALSSTRKQARVLSRHLQGRADFFDECFPVPKLVIFSGHMIDAPDRRVPRFPLEKEDEIRQLLEKQLEVMNAGIGFSSAACGSDILFLETMLARGGTIHIVLPWPADEFVKTSVDLDGKGTWNKRFAAVLARAASIRVLGQLYMPGSAIGFEYCNLAVNGLARLFARSLDLEITPLAVWEACGRTPAPARLRYWAVKKFP